MMQGFQPVTFLKFPVDIAIAQWGRWQGMKARHFVFTTNVGNRRAGGFMDVEDDSSWKRNKMFDVVSRWVFL